MKQRQLRQPSLSSHAFLASACAPFLSHPPIRIIQSVLKLTLTEESILACAVRARMVYLYIFFPNKLHVRSFRSLSDVSFFRPSHMFLLSLARLDHIVPSHYKL